jgi:hypothetical protein
MQIPFTFLVRSGFVIAIMCALSGGAISSNARAEDMCPNEALRQELQSGGLPDCRAYELITPPRKGGIRAELGAVSSDGSRAIVRSLGNYGDAGNSSYTHGATYELTRTSAGWSETGIDPPPSRYPYDELVGATPELDATMWLVRESSQSLSQQELLIRNEAGGALHDLGPNVNPAGTVYPPGLGIPKDGGVATTGYVGSSADFSTVLFWVGTQGTVAEEAKEPLLWPGDATAPELHDRSLYERDGDTGFEPTLVGVSNEGPLDGSPHINEGAVLLSQCGTNLGSPGGANALNAVSESGAHVFFTAEHKAECSGTQPVVNELYARVGGVKTLAISEPPLSGSDAVPGRECSGVCATDAEVPSDRSEGVFVGASRNGKQVFFLSAQPLVNGDEDAATDLYEAEIEGEGGGAHLAKLVQISHDPNLGQAAEVQGVTRVSEDGSHVYFVAKGVLASNTSAHAAPFSTAQAGGENLYVYEPDPERPGSYRTVFIAMLCSEEGMSGAVSDSECHSSDERLWSLDGEAPANTTQDGGFIVFSTASDLTGPEDTSTVGQVFRYDAETGELGRVSIGESGFNSDGNTDEEGLAAAPIRINDSIAETLGIAAVSDDGTVVFQSADGLTPAALNGQQEDIEYETLSEEGLEERQQGTFYANNVYEWEADGTEIGGQATCSEPAGCVTLISDGLDTTATINGGEEPNSSVKLYGQTPSGGDIFFTTADQLVPQDTDTQQDIYDARTDGGFPLPSVPVLCGESCQGAPASQPLFGTPTSATLSGLGNLAPPPPIKPAAKPNPKPLTRAQKLARAMKACHTKRNKRKRASCEREAHKKYGAKSLDRKSAQKARR